MQMVVRYWQVKRGREKFKHLQIEIEDLTEAAEFINESDLDIVKVTVNGEIVYPGEIL